jgi:hypothetical protein
VALSIVVVIASIGAHNPSQVGLLFGEATRVEDHACVVDHNQMFMHRSARHIGLSGCFFPVLVIGMDIYSLHALSTLV